jgi:hypothetical protein
MATKQPETVAMKPHRTMSKHMLRLIGPPLAKALEQFHGGATLRFQPVYDGDAMDDSIVEGTIVDGDWQCAMLRAHNGKVGMTVYPLDCEFKRHVHYWIETVEEGIAKYCHFMENHE